ncbi:glycosylphosphatidylinositol-alpha 1,2 mannosyltransferase [Sporobolomyces koalae]|uniref:glycosylphosphatidylinositol-alpha 1,2 mannosyltransferase n=1 Tax=Sporobolomyces koalae TaxID=500713 RepID=UPI00317064C3
MRKAPCCYAVLVLLRLIVAWTSFAIIHPDEHFQNPEVAASIVWEYPMDAVGLSRTWEWTAREPCRSIAPVWLTSGAAFTLLRGTLGINLSARAIFVAERTAMLVLSLFIDACIYKMANSILPLLLFASSPVTLAFLVRPFSNSIETACLALALCLGTAKPPVQSWNMLFLGAVLAFGLWTRVTFAAFALPLVVSVALDLLQQAFTKRKFGVALAQGISFLLSFALSCYSLSLLDTLHFSPTLSLSEVLLNPTSLVWTPINLLKYNLSAKNLALHGLHPRYLHALVNLPLLYGIGLAVPISVMLRNRSRSILPMNCNKQSLYLFSFAVPIVVLSIQPHQEPRFLIPLLVPLVLLAPQTQLLSRSGSSRKRRFFWSVWILHSCLATALFGYLHQGGVLPVLFRLNHELGQTDTSQFIAIPNADLNLVFWKTFMPPKHLLLRPGDQQTLRTSVIDLGGVSKASLCGTLLELVAAANTSSATMVIAPSYLFDPSRLTAELAASERLCFEEVFGGDTFGIHVDMDRLDELKANFGWSRLGVGAWRVTDCSQEQVGR